MAAFARPVLIIAAILALGFASRAACNPPKDPEDPCDRPGCKCKEFRRGWWKPGMVPE